MDKKLSLFFLYVLVSGFIFTFLVPPFQKPDENLHFLKALSVAKGKFFCTNKKSTNILASESTYSLVNDAEIKNLIRNDRRKIGLDFFKRKVMDGKSRGRMVSLNVGKVGYDNLCGFNFVPYIPHAFALSIGALFIKNAFLLFYFGRFLVFIFSVLFFKKIYDTSAPYLKNILLFIFGLPMTLHQLTAYSYDASHILLALCLFVYVFNLLKKNRVYFAELLKLMVLTVIFLLTKKGGYEPLILLVFIIPYRKISSSLTRYLLIMSVYIICLIALYLLIKAPVLYQDLINPSFPNNIIKPDVQAQNVIGNPLYYLFILINTTIHNIDFYTQGLIGIFGWLEYGLNPAAYFAYLLLFLLLIINARIKKSEQLSILQMSAVFITLLLSYFIILTAFYLVWIPISPTIIDGVQGRYFIALLPFLTLLLINLKSRLGVKELLKKIKINFLVVLLTYAFLIFSIVESVLKRYYF